MNYSKNIINAVGNTPLVQLNNIANGLKPKILAKLEYLNPGGSMKDRVAVSMIDQAEKNGLIKKGGTIVEPTSGNTGVGLASVAVVRGYKVIFTMTEKVSREKEQVLRAYGAYIIRCPKNAKRDDPEHYINTAKRIAKEKGAFFPNQYDNKANPQAHYNTTGPEIWNDTKGKITHLVAPVGTGGTITGIARYLKKQNPDIQVIGGDTEGSLLHHYFYKTEGRAHAYLVEGPGEDFMPKALDMSVIDEMIVVSDKQAFQTARLLVAKEGIFAGGSAGLAVHVALQTASNLSKNSTIVVILPDSGRSYISTFYDDDWMKKHKLL